MSQLYRSAAGEQLVRERYLAFLKYWPVPNQQMRVPTRAGETFVVASGDPAAPPLLLFHGGMGNSVMWMGDIAALATHFRVYAIDMIGEAGLSAPVRLPLESDAHALWLDDVMEALALERASIAGMSLGGWLALDYATRRPQRVQSLVVLCPGGVGRQKMGILFKVLPLRLCGTWGANKAREIVLGRPPASLSGKSSAGIQEFIKFVVLIHENFRSRLVKMPIFSDDALQRLTMPVMAVVGGKDVLLDSAGTKARLKRNVPQADIRYLPEAGHLLPRQTEAMVEFLRKELVCPA